jgi:hypothetical protein
LTYANRLLGGAEYATIVEGSNFAPAVDMTINSIYYDPHGLDGLGQLYSVFDRV